jgi:o-succinylbenzoate---CoA ligase
VTAEANLSSFAPAASRWLGPDAADWLRLRARASPFRPALVAGPEHWSFGELDRRVDRAARQLATLGVTAGTRVALVLRNGPPFVVLTHALARVGAVMAPMNIRLATAELAQRLADLHASLLICDQALALMAEAAARDLPDLRLIVTDAPEDVVQGARRRSLAVIPEANVAWGEHMSPSAVQAIIQTSATSGTPKGVQLTFGNHWWSAIGSALNLGHHPRDRWLLSLPLYHVGGLAILWRSVIYGIPVVLHEAFDPAAVNRDIDCADITFISVVPTMLQRLFEERGPRPFPAALRCVLLGGGPAPRALLETCVRLRVPVAPTYGLTEAASQVATLAPEEVTRKPGSVGQPLFPGEVRIVRDTTLAGVGEVGEIMVRGPTVMLGYADRPEETAQSLRGGWLHTGDLGYLDPDGYLYVVDRRDDLIISGGENVYPAEVETVLREHPAVEDAGVIGLPHAVWGQTVAAVVQVRAGSGPSAEEIKAFCRRRLAGYKIPSRIWFISDVPRSITGKLLRRKLRQWAATVLERDTR